MFRQLVSKRAINAATIKANSHAASTSASCIVAPQRPFHTTFAVLKKDDLTGVEVVDLPKKGKMPVPKHIQELGDKFVSLNVIENMILCEYIREKLGFDSNIPNPFSSMMRDAFGDLLLPGTPKHAVPGEAMMMQQQQMMAQMMAQGGGMFMGGMPGGAAAGGAAGAAEAKPVEEEKAPEKSHYDVKLEKYDEAQKIKLIKELRAIDPSLTIKAAKEAVEGAPTVIKTEVKKEDAEKLKAQLEALGATVALV